MGLHRLLYASRHTAPLSLTQLIGLQTRSAARNAAAGLTGLLLYHPPFFAQCLEGGAAEAAETFARIARDPRHAGVRLASFEPAQLRQFPDWSMRLVVGTADPAVEAAVRRHAGPDGFDPLGLPPAALLGLLTELAAAQAVERVRHHAQARPDSAPPPGE